MKAAILIGEFGGKDNATKSWHGHCFLLFFAKIPFMKFVHFFVLLFVLTVTSNAQKIPLTLEEAIFDEFGALAPRSKKPNFLPGSDEYLTLKDNSWYKGNTKGEESVWLTLDNFNAFEGISEPFKALPTFTWLSPNTAYFSSRSASKTGTNTSTSQYFLVDFLNKKVSEGPISAGDGDVNDFHAKSKAHAFSIKNNLFILRGKDTLAVTNEPDGIVSGQSISRNEYGIEKGTFWNDEGSLLAFYQKDERNVTVYPLTDYKKTPAAVREIKYPMAGATSEIIRVGVYDLNQKKTVYLEISAELNDTYYATNLAWSPDNTLYIIWMNRATNEMQLQAYDPRTGKKRATLIIEKDDKWVEPTQPIRFIPNQPNQFLWYSQKDGFHRYYKYDTSGKLLGSTKNNFEFTDFIGYDVKGEYAFVMGTGSKPTEQHAFRIKMSDMSIEQLTKEPGKHTVSISGSGKFIMDQYSNTKVSSITHLIEPGGKVIKSINNSPDMLEARAIGSTEIFSIKNNEGIDLYCRIIKPSNFDSKKKYPAVIYVYNGPHVQLVTESYHGGAPLWMYYLAENGFIVFTVDGRGSAHRGKAFEQSIHRNLGTVEIDDQLTGVNWLKSQPFIDGNRLGVHGWSYGGFMTTSLMLKHPDLFKAGVAGGPVIDWNLYEVMYTERYMDTPTENPEGYNNAKLTEYVKNLKGKLLMIHGADDDVVVMQHNMRFLNACIDNKVQVDFFVYPGHAHNVRGRDRFHLMKKVLDYLIENI